MNQKTTEICQPEQVDAIHPINDKNRIIIIIIVLVQVDLVGFPCQTDMPNGGKVGILQRKTL